MNIKNNFHILYKRIINSIAFLPAVIALSFLLGAIIMLEIDFSDIGTNLKSDTPWLQLKDSSTARSVISTIAAALLSLTVFSFSMVMIVLNQAASQMSNRVLTSMIQNRFQQVVLGCYIGTIVYSLTILSTIRDTSDTLSIPSLSIYLLIILTVIAIFLFIYFLDYVTKTVKYETVIDGIEKKTLDAIAKTFEPETIGYTLTDAAYTSIAVSYSGYFQGFNSEKLLRFASENNILIRFLYKRRTFIIKDNVLIQVYSKTPIDKETAGKILENIEIYKGQPIDQNPDYGSLQLAEVAIKALSPGINDPATAVLSINALTNILAQRMYCKKPEVYKDNENIIRIYCPSSGFKDIFEECIIPIWKYGKNDQYIQEAIHMNMKQLKEKDTKKTYHHLFDNLLDKIKE